MEGLPAQNSTAVVPACNVVKYGDGNEVIIIAEYASISYGPRKQGNDGKGVEGKEKKYRHAENSNGFVRLWKDSLSFSTIGRAPET